MSKGNKGKDASTSQQGGDASKAAVSEQAAAEAERAALGTESSMSGDQKPTDGESVPATTAPDADGSAEQPSPKSEEPQMRPCEICRSSFNDELGCANAECELNLERIAKAAAEAERAALIAAEVPKARECRLCNGERPCSPEHYMAAGHEVSDARFLELFGAPLRLSEASKRTGRIRCRVVERVAVGRDMYAPGDEGTFDASDVDSARHCFEELE